MRIFRLYIIVIGMLLLVFVSRGAIAEPYVYKDKYGIEHIQDSPPQNVPDTNTLDPETESSENTLPRVEIYLTSWCPYCKKAREFFTSRGISFSAYDIEKDPDAKRRKDEIDSHNGVPTVVINGKVVHGYNPEVYSKILEGKR